MDTPAIAPLNHQNAESALTEACASVGISATGAELIRLGENAVFRLDTHPAVIARVGRSLDRRSDFEREVEIARWLNANNVPAIRALPIPQPASAGGRVVTFWEAATGEPEFGTVTEFADLLRRFHALGTPPDIHLPQFDPLHRVGERIERATALTSDDREFLLRRKEELATQYRTLRFVLTGGPIHGDANVGNTLRNENGQALLADLDGFSIGPREWDLILTAIYYDRFGWHTADEYHAFAATYGYDVMAWEGYEKLADVREFSMVTWLAQNAGANTDVSAELRKRLVALRSGASRRDWAPF